MEAEQEILEGYVVDIACLRRYPLSRISSLARDHAKACSLMGHCIESGYGLVMEGDQIALLDSGATLNVVSVLEASPLEKGIRLRAVREKEGADMKVVGMSEV